MCNNATIISQLNLIVYLIHYSTSQTHKKISHVTSCRESGLNPIWLKNPLANVTSKLVFGDNKFGEVKTSNLLTGATQSDCKLPCTTVAAKTRPLMSLVGSPSELENMVDLIQSSSMKVTETKIISTSVSKSLAELV